MKKFFYMSVLVLMAALTLTSCGSDDDKKDEPKPTSKSVSYEATVTFAQDMIDICDVTMVYKDGDGKTVTEAVKSTTWSKKVSVNKLPAVVGVQCNYKLKDGVQLTKDKYDIIAELHHDVIVDGTSKGFSKTPFYFIQSAGVRADKLAEMLPRRSGVIYGYTITADAKVNETQNITF